MKNMARQCNNKGLITIIIIIIIIIIMMIIITIKIIPETRRKY